ALSVLQLIDAPEDEITGAETALMTGADGGGGGGGGGVEPESATKSCDGTLTMNASRRFPYILLVQIKYFPVTSILPFGYLQYSQSPPGALMSVMTGATNSVS